MPKLLRFFYAVLFSISPALGVIWLNPIVASQAVTRTIFNGVLNQSSPIMLVIDVKCVTTHLEYLKYKKACHFKDICSIWVGSCSWTTPSEREMWAMIRGQSYPLCFNGSNTAAKFLYWPSHSVIYFVSSHQMSYSNVVKIWLASGYKLYIYIKASLICGTAFDNANFWIYIFIYIAIYIFNGLWFILNHSNKQKTKPAIVDFSCCVVT